MKFELNVQEVMTITVYGVDCKLTGSGKIICEDKELELSELFSGVAVIEEKPKVDYSKIAITEITSDRYTIEHLKERGVYNLKKFVEVNNKILEKSSKNKDIFHGLAFGNSVSCIDMYEYWGYASGIILSIIANTYRLTGEFSIELMYRRKERSCRKSLLEKENLLSKNNLTVDMVLKQYCTYYKAEEAA